MFIPAARTQLANTAPGTRLIRMERAAGTANHLPGEQTATDGKRPALAARPDSRRGLALRAASVPLAAAAQWSIPALLPLSAGVVALTSLPSFRGAWQALARERRLRGDVLDAIIAAGCLATGSVFAGSLLCLFQGYEPLLSGASRERTKTLLLNSFGKVPQTVQRHRGAVLVETHVAQLNPGDLVHFGPGDVIAVDGVIQSGAGLVDQQSLTGDTTAAEKTAGEQVLAGTLLITGHIDVEVRAAGTGTVTARIEQMLFAAAGTSHGALQRGERFADRAILPTLALAGLALTTVGPSGAMAIVYSDFRTGLRLSIPMAMLATVAQCAHRGLLIKDVQALERLPDVDVLVVDQIALPAGASASADAETDIRNLITAVRQGGVQRCLLLTDLHGLDQQLQTEARNLGFDDCVMADTTAAKVELVRQLQQAGHKVCFVGDGLQDAAAEQIAHVSISTRGVMTAPEDAAQIVLLSDNTTSLLELWPLTDRLATNVRRNRTLAVAPNVMCMAGALSLGLGVLGSMFINGIAVAVAVLNSMTLLRKAVHERQDREMLQELRGMYHSGNATRQAPQVLEAECLSLGTTNHEPGIERT